MTSTEMVPTLADVQAIVGGEAKSDPRAAMAAALAAIAAKNGGSTRAYLFFDTKSGIMSYKNGDKKVVVGEDVELAVNMLGVKQVMTCWKDGQPVDKIEVPFYEDLPDVSTLPMHGIDVEACEADDECRDGWSDSLVIPVKDVESGQEFDLMAPNMTTKNAAGKLMEALSKEVALYDPATQFPVVTVGTSTYKSRSNFTVYVPVYEIKRWDSAGGDAKPKSSSKVKK